MNKLVAMEVFIKVAEAASFTRAAEELSLSRSAASDHIADLEQHLGVRLLNRTTRRVSLTSEGEVFLSRARQVMSLMETAEEEASAGALTPHGRLRVNAPVSFGQHHLGPMLTDFLHKYPEIEIELTLTDRLVDVVEEGFDLVLRIGRLPDSTLVARRVGTIRLLLCASPDYLAQHGTPQHPADLARHSCIHLIGTAWHTWSFEGPEGTVSVPVTGRLTANNVDTLMSAASAGMGFSLVPNYVAVEAIRQGRLVEVLPEYRSREIQLHAVQPPGHLPVPKTRALIDFLAEQFRLRSHEFEPPRPG
ncbi:LysR family transcriptional regulator [Roseomonas elaeocarpi]|uniref:LysR family transcriptional regulator n=1 Tax=Roseomonas elaeocarpi TaxID=907779 RepID=A0ABV6JSU1_9PROT